MLTKYIDYNIDTAYLLESLKVESYYNRKNFTATLQNKDIDFLNHIELILLKYDIIPRRRLLIKIRLLNNTKAEEISLQLGQKSIRFHIEKSPFDSNKVKIVTSIPYISKDSIILKLKESNEGLTFKFNGEKNTISGKNDCWMYRDLRFPHVTLFNFLETFGGLKNDFTDILFNSNEKVVASAFSALVDCEGTISWYGLKRLIQIRMRNKDYLLNWSKVLDKFDIGNKFRKNKNDWEINISGWEDFSKLESIGFKLFNSTKSEKWNKMMKGFKRNQISRGTYKDFYLTKIKEIGKDVTSKEFALYLSKNPRTVNHFLNRLSKEGLIHQKKNTWPYLYSIST